MPERNLKIALIPLDIKLGESDENLEAALKRISALERDTDVAVLPEMFSTGYTTDRDALHAMARESSDKTLDALMKWSSESGFALAGTYLATTETGVNNRAFFITPDGDRYFYNKRHLFTAGGEHKLVERGIDSPTIITYLGWKIRLSVCYDIRFPVWNRSAADGCDNHYDLLIVPANWPHSREYAWRHLLIARAIENLAFVAGCNREGEDAYGVYEPGDSFVFNYWGKPIGTIEAQGTIYATLDAEGMAAGRKRFPALNDADRFEIL